MASMLIGVAVAFAQVAEVHGGDPGTDPLLGLTRSASYVLVIVGLLSITLIINNFIEKAHIPIPEAIVTVVIGIVAGGIMKLFPDVSSKDVILSFEDQAARQFMLVFIAPIIFAEGYGMKSRQFFENITRILSHAFVGTVISAFVVAAFVYYLPPLTGFHTTVPFIQCLTFGVLISATDPVTTLAIFKSMNMVENGLSHLYFSVLGESILNDAVAITLFDGLSDVVRGGEDVTAMTVLKIAGGFCATFFGSMAIGVCCGLLSALILKFGMLGAHEPEEEHYHFNVPEVGVAISLAYVPFLIASSIPGQSGIVAVLFAGMVMRHFAHYNLTETSRNLFLPTIELLASLCETYVFLILGLGVFLLKANAYSVIILLWSVLGCLIGRVLNVYPISFVINSVSNSQRLTANEFHVVWFAGLRGAIAFMCAMRFPAPKPQEGVDNDFRDIFLSTTMLITLMSMVFLGWPTGAFLRCLDIKGPEAPLLSVVDEEEAAPESRAKKQSRLMNAIDGGRAAAFGASLKRLLMTPEAQEERASNWKQAQASRNSLPSLPHDSRPPLGGSRSSGALGARRSSGLLVEPRATDPTVPLARDSNASGPPTGRTSEALSYGRSSSARGLPRASGPLESRQSGGRSFRTLCNP